MSKTNSTVKIVNGKVELSQEVLSIIESWRTEENSEWVDKYLEIISDPSNIGSKKSRCHHIIPCFTFKDENHKNRKETEPLANQIKENKIELSIGNHIIAHNFLRLIFPNNKDAKTAFQRMSKEENIEDLTYEEIKIISQGIEEATKDNVTDEIISLQHKKKYQENKAYKLKQHKDYNERNKDKLHKQYKNYRARICYDPIKEKRCTFETLRTNIRRHEDLYKDVVLNDCIMENQEENLKIYLYEKEIENKKKKELQKKRKNENHKKYHNQLCYDPIKQDVCIFSTLYSRILNHKDLYENIIPSQCIIRNNSIS